MKPMLHINNLSPPHRIPELESKFFFNQKSLGKKKSSHPSYPLNFYFHTLHDHTATHQSGNHNQHLIRSLYDLCSFPQWSEAERWGFSLSLWAQYKPHFIIATFQLWLAIFMIMLQSILSKGISALVLVVYEHAVSTCILYFLEKGKRPAFSFQILVYSFLLALLMISMYQVLLTLSLQYVAATSVSIALNVMPMVIFVAAVLLGMEELKFGTIHGQAKIWGVSFSAAGALTMVLWTGPTLLQSTPNASKGSIIGGTMLVMATLADASWNLLVGQVTRKYPAELSLTAMISFFGTIQTAVVTGFLETGSSWKLEWEGGFTLIAILWGGILVTGLFYYAETWCIHLKGPVFTNAFQPLLIIFSFILDATVLGESTHCGSIIGAVLVVLGLYILLWGKTKDKEREGMVEIEENIKTPLIF